MNVDKYYKDGYWIDPIDGCHYDSAKNYISTEILRFCGCGDVDAALKYVMQSLEVANMYLNSGLEIYDKACKEHFKDIGAMYHMYYYLDKQNLIQHGSSVPGWLTQLGKEVLEDLKELYKDDI